VDGTPFGHYRFIELLGRGGMGEVWRAYDTVTDRVVAIKVLPAHLSEDKEYQQRFRREAHAAARLNDPHVIPIHNYGEIDGRLYVDMRLIEGRDLQTVLTAGPLSPTRAVHIIQQVAKALNAAHRIGLVHRDVKPSNILLDADDFAYLIDFGIARRADQTKLTSTGATIGTWAYMSPERMRSGEVDARTDIYALACVLYECLTGSPPFPGDTFESQALAHLMDPPPRPSITQLDVPPQVDEVIATGMAKDPGQRYATTIELADAARDAITDPIARPAPTPTQPRTESTPSPVPAPAVTKYRQPQPPPSPWAPADTRRHAQTFAPPLADFGPTRQPVAPAPTPQPQRRTGLLVAIVATVVVAADGIIGVTGYLLLKQRHPSPTPTAQPAPPSSLTPNTPQPTPAPPPPPPPPNALDGLLLSVEDIDTAMGTTGMSSVGTMTTMPDFSSRVPDKACLPLAYAVQPNVYAGSGSGTMRAEVVQKPQQNAVTQAVVLFPSPQAASSFFTASTQSWQACSNRQFTIAMNGNSQLQTVGPISNTNGTLSATVTPAGSLGFCERALTAANDVAVDVTTCAGPAGAAVNIAHQIAAKVPVGH
jgi:serine/threonine kinase PknH